MKQQCIARTLRRLADKIDPDFVDADRVSI
jgi:hypothetical protein